MGKVQSTLGADMCLDTERKNEQNQAKNIKMSDSDNCKESIISSDETKCKTYHLPY